MPPVVAAIGAYIGGAIGAAIVTYASVIATVVSLAASFAISALSKPDLDFGDAATSSSGSPLTDEVNRKMQIVRSSVEPIRNIYGSAVVGGTMVFIDSKDLFNMGQKQFAYMVIAIAPHELNAIKKVIWESDYIEDIDKEYYQSNTDGTGQLWNDGFEIHFLGHNQDGLLASFTIDGTSYVGYPIWLPDGGGDSFANYLDIHGLTTYFYLSDRVRSYDQENLDQSDVDDHEDILERSRMMFIFNSDHDALVSPVPISTLTSANAIHTDLLIGTYFPKWNGNSFDTYLIANSVNPYPRAFQVDAFVNNNWQLQIVKDGEITEAKVQIDNSGEYCVWEWNGTSYDTVCYPANPTIAVPVTTQRAEERVTNVSFSIDGGTSYSPELISKTAILQNRFYLGDQTDVDGELNGLFPEWNGIGYGLSYAILRWFYDYDRLPNGIPNMRFLVSGKPIYNPVTDTTATSNNASLVILDYLRDKLGLGLDDADIDFDSWTDNVAICDRLIPTSDVKTYSFGQEVELLGATYPELTITNHGFTESGIAKILLSDLTYVEDVRFVVVDDFTLRLERQFDATDLSSGTLQEMQRQYTIDGTANSTNRPSDILQEMMVNIGYGKLIYNNGQFSLKAGTGYVIEGVSPNKTIKFNIDESTYTSSSSLIELDESFIAGNVSISPYFGRDKIFNGVKGTFLGNEKSDHQATSFHQVQNSSYCQMDNGGQECLSDADYIYKDVQYNFTIQNIKAQRYAKILLERSRQALTVKFKGNMKCYILDVGDICTLTLSDLGFTDKEFEVTGWGFSVEGGIDLTLQETASTIYDWNLGDENRGDLAPNTDLENLSWTRDLVDIDVVSRAVFTAESQIKEKIFVSVTSDSGYQFYKDTEVQYRKVETTDESWSAANKGENQLFVIEDVELTRYVIRARRLSRVSAPTQWLYADYTAQGAGSLITEVNMPKPINPLVYFSVINDHIDKMRISVDFKLSEWTEEVPAPEYLAIMYAIEESINDVGIVDDSLIAEGTEILASDTAPVLDDPLNSVSKIRVWEAKFDTSVDLAGMWWVQIRRANNSLSKAIKVDRYDGYYIYLARDLSFTPNDTDIIEIYEMAFHDMRQDEFKLGSVVSGSDYEVIKWDDLQFNNGQFQFEGVTRAVEDSTSLDATGKRFSYFPAPGYGTSIVIVPASSFNLADSDTLQSTFEFDVTLPDGFKWGAVTCMFGTTTTKNGLPIVYRSPIVPLVYAGER